MSVNFIINQIKEKWNNLTRGVSVIIILNSIIIKEIDTGKGVALSN